MGAYEFQSEPECGDQVVDIYIGEACDDGDLNAGCSDSCEWEAGSGGEKSAAGASCAGILASFNVADGVYWIDPTGHTHPFRQNPK